MATESDFSCSTRRVPRERKHKLEQEEELRLTLSAYLSKQLFSNVGNSTTRFCGLDSVQLEETNTVQPPLAETPPSVASTGPPKICHIAPPCIHELPTSVAYTCRHYDKLPTSVR